MRYLDIAGPTQAASVVGLGGRFGEIDPDRAFELLDAFVEAGGTLIDTAHAYADGESERTLSTWMGERGNRARILLVDKGCHPGPGGRPRVHPRLLRSDLRESLDRLMTDHIDLFLLHRDDPAVPVEPLVDALNQEVASGTIARFGVSNWRPERVDAANRYARSNGLMAISVVSTHLSLAVPREPLWPGTLYADAEVRLWHRHSEVPLLAWSSQARGWFSGRHLRADSADGLVRRVYRSPGNLERLRRARALASAHRCSATAVALAYVLCQPFQVVALIGPETLPELLDSLSAIDLRLSPEDLLFLEGAAPPGAGPAHGG